MRYLLILILPFASCTGFQHAHYRHIDKVEAKGAAATAFIREQPEHQTPGKKSADEAQTSTDPAIFPAQATAAIVPAVKSGSTPTVPEKTSTRNSTPLPLAKKNEMHTVEPAPVNEGLGALISFVVLVFAFILVASGISLVFLGIFWAIPLMILAGALYFLVGSIPLYILIRGIIVGRRLKGPYESKR